MKPYSVDLRQKIIDIYAEGNVSQRQLARQFRVALSFIQKLIKQYKETGNIAPKVRRKQTPTKLTDEQLQVLKKLVAETPEATLQELKEKLAAIAGVTISISTVHRMLRRLDLCTQKNGK
ncbi:MULTISPECIES: helix-turn-helix domain-containing protein [Planktothricoides]|uniref:Transposase n=2 Tax=Planktothricoides raciborskii TaxID=132608 RepID=A0AAU8JF73_9CYAN|nr:MULTISPECIES: helix-turn-helix domain-containing protein [Planktothricoides]KOR35410.1 transcriptional regulator [Planktothricoides sp. SR001]MBD2545948.1 transposase [Planktothricoides raciborskii FACHB-1370]MBD2584065.1 transposase [Planktothricoides raciborskii FACHB-1261]